MSLTIRWGLLLAAVLSMGGCGSSESKYSENAARPMDSKRGDAGRVPAVVDVVGGTSNTFAAGESTVKLAGDEAGVVPAKKVPSDKPAITRQIVYTSQVTLVVEKFDGIPSRVNQLVAEFGGFIVNSNLSGSSGSSRTGTWTIRIPVPQYDAFVDKVAALGNLANQSMTSREVTDEYYDVEARIRNMQRTEERLLTHLEKSTGKLEEILTIEREIGRVRGELEQLQGRLRVLQDITALSTITLTVNELVKYTPPPPVKAVEVPTFTLRVKTTWNGSVASLRSTVENFIIFLVAVGPWLVIVVPLVVGTSFVVRGTLVRHKLRKSGAAQT